LIQIRAAATKQKQLDDEKSNWNLLREYKSVWNKIMKALRKERGKPALSLIQTIDDTLNSVSPSSYHGGNLNGVCTCLVLSTCGPIMTNIIVEILSGRKESQSLTGNMVRAKIGQYTCKLS
jgi:hypothetical protein